MLIWELPASSVALGPTICRAEGGGGLALAGNFSFLFGKREPTFPGTSTCIVQSHSERVAASAMMTAQGLSHLPARPAWHRWEREPSATEASSFLSPF